MGLPISTSHNGSVGTLLIGELKQTNGLVDGALAGALGEEVVAGGSTVRPTDTLNPDIVNVTLQ